MCMMFDYNVFDYRKLEPWKEYKKKIWFLTEEEEKLIINYAKKDKTKDEVFKTRDLAILLTFINTWIRVQELCNIKVKDIAEEIQIEW
jgi:integrase